MILQNITSIEDISKYPAPLARALEYLKNTDFSTLEGSMSRARTSTTPIPSTMSTTSTCSTGSRAAS